MSGSMTNWYDPNLYSQDGGARGTDGYTGTVNSFGDFARSVGNGLGVTFGGLPGAITLGTSLVTGKDPSLLNTLGAAKGALSNLLGLGEASPASGGSGGFGPGQGTNTDPVGEQTNAEDAIGMGGYAQGGVVATHLQEPTQQQQMTADQKVMLPLLVGALAKAMLLAPTPNSPPQGALGGQL